MWPFSLKTESGKNRIMIIKVYLAIPKLIGVNGLNLPEVGKLLVPSIPVKLSHMDSYRHLKETKNLAEVYNLKSARIRVISLRFSVL